MKRTKLDDRVLPVYTKGEEIFNMVTHIVGGAMGIAALVLCIIFCHDGYGLFSGIVYGISMILLYTMSAIYHGLSPKLKAKKCFPNYGSLQYLCIDCGNLHTGFTLFNKRS